MPYLNKNMFKIIVTLAVLILSALSYLQHLQINALAQALNTTGQIFTQARIVGQNEKGEVGVYPVVLVKDIQSTTTPQ